jgi:hypothetical protein
VAVDQSVKFASGLKAKEFVLFVVTLFLTSSFTAEHKISEFSAQRQDSRHVTAR